MEYVWIFLVEISFINQICSKAASNCLQHYNMILFLSYTYKIEVYYMI